MGWFCSGKGNHDLVVAFSTLVTPRKLFRSMSRAHNRRMIEHHGVAADCQ